MKGLAKNSKENIHVKIVTSLLKKKKTRTVFQKISNPTLFSNFEEIFKEKKLIYATFKNYYSICIMSSL